MLPAAGADNQALMKFLQTELQHLEAASGGEEDAEARALLRQLEQKTAVLQTLAQQQPASDAALSEVELAHQLDKYVFRNICLLPCVWTLTPTALLLSCCSLDNQLSQIEASLAAADAPTLELLGQSTSRWMHQAAAGSPSAAADTQQHSPASAADKQQKLGSTSTTGNTLGAGGHSSVDAAAATAAAAAVPAGTTPGNNALQPPQR